MSSKPRAVGLACLILAAPAPAGHAQAPKAQVYGIADGLPGSQITALGQDRSGRLWILTSAGLASYDGELFTTDTRAGLPTAELSALEVEAGGRLWTLARWGGPAVYHTDGERWASLPLPSTGLPATAETSRFAVLSWASRPLVAVGTRGHGLWLWSGGRWTSRGTRDGLASDTVTALAPTADGLAIGTTAGLCRLRGGDVDCSDRLLRPRLAEAILALFADRDPEGRHRLWILTHDWLGSLVGGELRIAREALALPRTVYESGSLLVDTAGGVYCGVPNLLHYLPPDGGDAVALGRGNGLANEGVSALLEDREANVWVGASRGLSMVDSWRFASFDERAGLLEGEVSAIAEPRPGTLVLGHNEGLTLLSGARTRTVRIPRPPGAASDAVRVMDLTVDRDGVTWVAAHRAGLLRVTVDGAIRSSLPDLPIISVETDASGRLWAAGRDELLVREGGRFRQVDPGLGDFGRVRWLTASPTGGMYVSTSSGLLSFDGEAWRIARSSVTESDILYGVLASRSDEVWVGTRAGLYRLAGDRLSKVRLGELEIDRPVFFILEDRAGRTWFGTDDGVMQWDGERLRHLTSSHGLAGRETNRGAGFIDSEGRLWIGTDRGLSLYQPAYDRPPAMAPWADIAALDVAGRQRRLDAPLALGPSQNTLTFTVSARAFSREDPIVLRYRLEGLEDGWQGPYPRSQSMPRYTHVPPGDYRFHVAAGWAGGAWGPAAVSPSIAIAPPLWLRPWFLALLSALVAAAVLGAHRLQTRAIRARNLELESLNARLTSSIAERQRLIRELEDKNAELERFAYTVSHDLKSPLVTISGFVDLVEQDATRGDLDQLASDVDRIRVSARRMTRLLGELLNLSRIGRVANPAEALELTELAREAVSSLTARIDETGAEVEISERLPRIVGDRSRLLEVLQNLVENALKFTRPGAPPQVEIGARQETAGDPQRTVLYVRDNGPGIEPRFHDKVFGLFERLDPGTEGAGVGLALVRRIVESHGGRCWIESEGAGGGTTVCFTLPEAGPERPAPPDT